jgi:hypothetical protein
MGAGGFLLLTFFGIATKILLGILCSFFKGSDVVGQEA